MAHSVRSLLSRFRLSSMSGTNAPGVADPTRQEPEDLCDPQKSDQTAFIADLDDGTAPPGSETRGTILLRSEVVGKVLALYKDPAYLEIGVNQGETFHAIKARNKVAVDPHFLFEAKDSFADGRSEQYFQVTSDDYFAHNVPAGLRFDVIYIDGLHTFEQTLRDILNAITVLQENGTIVIDDVIPNSYDASIADLNEVMMLRELATQVGFPWTTDGSWMGDVYKIPFFVESFMPQFSYATVAENHGQTIMWREPRSTPPNKLRTVESIARLEYRHCLLERSVFKLQPMADILRRIEIAHARRVA